MIGSSKHAALQDPSNRERIREVIRLLNLAIEDCHRLLAETEQIDDEREGRSDR